MKIGNEWKCYGKDCDFHSTDADAVWEHWRTMRHPLKRPGIFESVCVVPAVFPPRIAVTVLASATARTVLLRAVG